MYIEILISRQYFKKYFPSNDFRILPSLASYVRNVRQCVISEYCPHWQVLSEMSDNVHTPDSDTIGLKANGSNY